MIIAGRLVWKVDDSCGERGEKSGGFAEVVGLERLYGRGVVPEIIRALKICLADG